MRKLLTMVALALTLGFGAALPAAADPGERSWRDWSEGPRYFHRAPEQTPAWPGDLQRALLRRGRKAAAARVTLGQRYTKRQHAARMAKKARRHQIARRPAKGQQRKVVVHRPRPHKPAAAAKLAPKVAARKTAVDTEQEGSVDRRLARRRPARRCLVLLARPTPRLGRSVQPQRHDGGAQDAAVRHQGARQASRQRTHGRRDHQRPRAVHCRAHHRSLQGRRRRHRHDGSGACARRRGGARPLDWAHRPTQRQCPGLCARALRVSAANRGVPLQTRSAIASVSSGAPA